MTSEARTHTQCAWAACVLTREDHPLFNHVAADSFPVPTYLFFKGDERPGRNDVKVAGQAGKGERKVSCQSLPDFRAAFP